MAKRKDKTAKLLRAQKWQNKIEEKKKAGIERSERSRYSIPKEVTFVPFEEQLLSSISSSCYVMVFGNYNHTQCGLLELSQSNESEALIKKLDSMSRSSPASRQSIIGGTIHRKESDGVYKKLFETVPIDVDCLYELCFAGEGRIFFFTLETVQQRNFVNIVSIKRNHIPLD